MTLEFKKEIPKCEGQYLIHWKSGAFETINVYYRKPYVTGSIEWSGGLFYRQRLVSLINLDMAHGIAKLPD